jgi:hypothetical protein
MEKLSVKYLNELLLLSLSNKEVLEVICEHLKYQYIPDEFVQYKKILKSIITLYQNTSTIPTVGIISQQHIKDHKVQETLTEIQKSSFPEKDLMLQTLERYVKQSKFVLLNDKLFNLYNEGKHEEAIELQAKESPEIVNYTINNNGSYYSKVYGGFNKRLGNRVEKSRSEQDKSDKILFGIYPLDVLTDGGLDVSDTVLWILRSGVGKSTALKWNAISAVRKHRNVLHIQLEGSLEECEDKYDQIWTACLYRDIKKGNINGERYQKLQKIINYMQNSSVDIFIHAFEQFNSASCVDVRNLISDFNKIYGHVDEVIIDYLKHLHPGDGVKYGADIQGVKMKKENASEKLKNLAVEFRTRIITADQASDVPMEIWNDPNKVLTRHNISGAKNLPDSYSYVFTGNQTNDERKKEVMRIHPEKLRNYKLPDKPIRIATDYDHGRFFDFKRSRELYVNPTTGEYEF